MATKSTKKKTARKDPKPAKPFLSAQRHDVLRDLSMGRNQLIERNIISLVGRGLDKSIPKIDGKGGAVDGTIGVINQGGIAAFVPICGAYPGPKVEHPKGKDSKEGKEQKDSKESKEGKDSKDGKEGKEGKDSKDGKEGKEAKDGKEDKDSSDGFKTGGDENSDPFSRVGDIERLPNEVFATIARTFPAKLQQAIARGTAIF